MANALIVVPWQLENLFYFIQVIFRDWNACIPDDEVFVAELFNLSFIYNIGPVCLYEHRTGKFNQYVFDSGTCFVNLFIGIKKQVIAFGLYVIDYFSSQFHIVFPIFYINERFAFWQVKCQCTVQL